MRTFKNSFNGTSFKTLYITTEKEAEVAILGLDPKILMGLDIETAKIDKYKEHPQAGLCPHLSRIRLLQIYDPAGIVYVFDLFYVPLETLSHILKKGRFVAHFATFEILHLTHSGFPNLDIGCSMLLSQLIDGAEHSPFEPPDEDDEDPPTGMSVYRKRTSHSLAGVTKRLFKVDIAKTQQVSDWAADTLSTEQITYAALDAVLTYKIAMVLAPKLIEYKMQRIYKLLKDMQHVVAAMQLEGLPVDWKYHAKLIKGWEKDATTAEKKCLPFFGETNMRSGPQMGVWLKEYLKDDLITLANWPRTKKGAYAFGKTVITSYKHLPPIEALLEYKKSAKLLDTYGESLIEKRHPITQRLHTSYTLGETRTGRMSSREPNVQNFPRDKNFRNMFCAPNDYVLVVSDFSQIELRLQAEFSKDPVMQKVYKNKEDIYCTMASVMYGRSITKKDKDERFVGKTVCLALGYGMGKIKLEQYALNAGIVRPFSFWEKAWGDYYALFNVYVKWCDKIRRRTEKLGYIETLLGKRRKLEEDELYTKAPNTVIQGSAFELMAIAMLICQKNITDTIRTVATVHDELALLCHKKDAGKAKNVLANAMNQSMKEMFPNAASLEVADAAYGVRWGDIKAEL